MNQMKLLLAIVLFSFAAEACVSASEFVIQSARMFSNQSAIAVEAMQVSAELLYYKDQIDAMESVAVSGPDATEAEMRAAILQVRSDWVPIRAMFAEARKKHEELIAAIESKQSADVVASKVAEMLALQTKLVETMREIAKVEEIQ